MRRLPSKLLAAGVMVTVSTLGPPVAFAAEVTLSHAALERVVWQVMLTEGGRAYFEGGLDDIGPRSGVFEAFAHGYPVGAVPEGDIVDGLAPSGLEISTNHQVSPVDLHRRDLHPFALETATQRVPRSAVPAGQVVHGLVAGHGEFPSHYQVALVLT